MFSTGRNISLLRRKYVSHPILLVSIFEKEIGRHNCGKSPSFETSISSSKQKTVVLFQLILCVSTIIDAERMTTSTNIVLFGYSLVSSWEDITSCHYAGERNNGALQMSSIKCMIYIWNRRLSHSVDWFVINFKESYRTPGAVRIISHHQH